MAALSNEAIKKAVKRVYSILRPKKVKRVNPDQYLSLLRYREGPTVWNQKWESHPYRRRHN